MRNILEIKNLVVSYGGIEAVKGIDLTVEEGKIVTLIGSNGAGKSTTLKAVAGLVRPKSGEILLDGTNLVGKSTDQIVSSGVTLVPEGRRVFFEPDRGGESAHRRIPAQDSLADDLARVYDLFPRLKEREWQQAGTLGRRAADAGRRPGADGQAEAHHDGRTVARPCADRRARDL